jgi:hypothetical protein
MNDKEIFVECAGRAEMARPRTVPLKRFAGGCLLVFLMGVISGCYTYAPVQPSTPPGSVLVLGLNDQGRVDLGSSVGPAAQTIEGTLEAKTDSAYVLSVSSVSYFNGGTNKWSGEPLTIGKMLVQDIKQRQFSRSRTFVAVAAASAGVLAFVLSRSLFSSSSPERQGNPGPPQGQ